MRDEIKLTDDQIDDLFNEVGGYDGYNPVLTRETLDDFIAARTTYAEHGRTEEGALESGERYVVTEGVQVSKGQQRRDVVVIDFGTVRAVAQ